MEVKDEVAAKEGHHLISERVDAAESEVKLEDILFQYMVPQGVETNFGSARDRKFGPMVMFGLGGFFEMLRDIVF